jgi:hypothetical protein
MLLIKIGAFIGGIAALVLLLVILFDIIWGSIEL